MGSETGKRKRSSLRIRKRVGTKYTWLLVMAQTMATGGEKGHVKRVEEKGRG